MFQHNGKFMEQERGFASFTRILNVNQDPFLHELFDGFRVWHVDHNL